MLHKINSETELNIKKKSLKKLTETPDSRNVSSEFSVNPRTLNADEASEV